MKTSILILFMVLLGSLKPIFAQQELHIQVNQPPPLEIYPLEDISTSYGEPVVLGDSIMVSGGYGFYYYHWNPVAFLDNPASEQPVATVNQTTTFNLIITDANGCSVSGQQVVFVETNSIGERMNDGLQVRIYPVPAHDELNIEFPLWSKLTNVNYTIVNTKGIPVSEQRSNMLNARKDKLQLNHLEPGVYTLIITCESHIIRSKLIIY